MLTHISFGKGTKTLAILIPRKNMQRELLLQYYVKPLGIMGVPQEEIIALSLDQNSKGKSPVGTVIRPHLSKLEKILAKLEIEAVLIADSSYFKTICNVRKVEPHLGYPKKTCWEDIIGFSLLNYTSLFYNPAGQSKISFALKAASAYMKQEGGMFSEQVLTDFTCPSTDKEIIAELEKLKKIRALTCDIEAYSLRVDLANIATISFSQDQHTAVAFSVGDNPVVRHYLTDFFTTYQGRLIFHGSPYDCKVIIWELFMKHPRDYKGMLRGLHIMFRNLEDTKILAYLSLNTTAGVSLSLKDLAFEYVGNYALDDISDITKVSPANLLLYNATDTVATAYIYSKYKPIVLDTQLEVYRDLFLPALKVITQMELVGMPLNLGQVLNTQRYMDDIARVHYKAIMTNPIVDKFNDALRIREAEKATAKLKKKIKTKDDFLHLDFNPNSNIQLAFLLHEFLDLPILGTTDTGAPSTTNKTLKNQVQKIKHSKTPDQAHIDLIEHIIELSDVNKILTTFIPAFKNSSIEKDGWSYLHGGFNLGGTKSGRLSSSKPNLTNIPSTGTQYAVPIKKCFQVPPKDGDSVGWLMVGADFDSLEDKVSALQTNDPNKLKIYTDGFDGHCLRAYKYFGDKMPDIIPDNVASINSIETKYPDLRQLSKSPTFLLTYMGTWHGLIKQFGFTKSMAQKIETDYHDLYKVSDDWVMDRVREAAKVGYATLAFGLRLRTPILPQVVMDSESIPTEAHKEIKTVGNAFGQSYGLLNTRAANEFMQRVWDSKYATKVLPICQIHDSLYFMIENTLGCVEWVNNNLIECMEWNELEPIQHPTVKLSASLEIYYPTWAEKIKIPNRVSITEIRDILYAI